MTFDQATEALNKRGWELLAQARHKGGLVSYDAVKGTGKWPHGRKLAVGEPRKTPHQARVSCLNAAINRDLPTARRRVIEA